MIRIGFIDNYLDEWHANNYPRLFAKAAEKTGIACEVVGAFALRDAPNGKKSTDEWCLAQGIRRYDSPEALAKDCDALLVFAPDDPELHPALAARVLPLGKPTFMDKTFALTAEDARGMLALAERLGVRMYSTSSLRYAEEVQAARGRRNVRLTGNYVHLKDYLVHVGEMLVSIIGTGLSAVRLCVSGAEYRFEVRCDDGRGGEIILTPKGQFSIDGTEVKSDFFARQIEQILRFFAGAEIDFDLAESIDVAKFVQGGLLAAQAENEWIDLSAL